MFSLGYLLLLFLKSLLNYFKIDLCETSGHTSNESLSGKNCKQLHLHHSHLHCKFVLANIHLLFIIFHSG